LFRYKESQLSLVIYLLAIFAVLFSSPSIVLATSSTDFSVDPENEINSFGQNSNSSDFQVGCQQVGDLAIGESTDSGGTIIQHGFPCIPETDTILDFIFSPQGRYGTVLTNDQSRVTIEVRPTGGNENSFIFSQEVTTLADGSYTGLVLTGVSPGNYDITAKGWATLRIKKTNVTILSTLNNIDFTDTGTNRAVAGDIDVTNRSSVGSAEQGDNEISAGDYPVLVGNYNLTGPSYDRIDLDQFDNSASAADYSILVSNYNLAGDN